MPSENVVFDGMTRLKRKFKFTYHRFFRSLMKIKVIKCVIEESRGTKEMRLMCFNLTLKNYPT